MAPEAAGDACGTGPYKEDFSLSYKHSEAFEEWKHKGIGTLARSDDRVQDVSSPVRLRLLAKT